MNDLIKVCVSDDFEVDYDKERGMYRVSIFKDYHFLDEFWFDAYEEKEVRDDFPKCFVGDIVWCTYYYKKPRKCKVSMLQQKADKSWKIRLSPEKSGVCDITLDEFNRYCFYTEEEAWESIKDNMIEREIGGVEND